MAVERLSDTENGYFRILCVLSHLWLMLHHGLEDRLESILSFGSWNTDQSGKGKIIQPIDTAVLMIATGDKLHRKCMLTGGSKRKAHKGPWVSEQCFVENNYLFLWNLEN